MALLEVVTEFTELVQKKTYVEQLVRFYEAELNAFAQAEISFEEVSFTCPICTGEAVSSRLSTPDDPTYLITILGYCKACGISHTSGVRQKGYNERKDTGYISIQ